MPVPVEDMIPFRGALDPADPLNGLSPITAVRLEVEATLEAQRYNLKFFDQGAANTLTFTAEDIEPLEARRLEDEINRRLIGTDNAHRLRVLEGNLKPVMQALSQKDMEFILQQKWSLDDVGRAFDLSPIALKNFERATYENAPEALAQDWTTVLEELRAILGDFTEYCLKPDFGEDLRLWAKGEDIAQLNSRRKEQAEIDVLYLDAGKQVINELRERDGEEPVAWGEEPLKAQLAPDFMPGDSNDPDPPRGSPYGLPYTAETRSDDVGGDGLASRVTVPETPSTEDEPELVRLERLQARHWEGRLTTELRGVIQHLDRESQRALDAEVTQRVLEIDDVESYGWDWARRYGARVAAELQPIVELALAEGGFVETPLLNAQELAERHARFRAGEMLTQVSDVTRQRVRRAVAEAIESGQGIRGLKNTLRGLHEFSASRAEAIARTETATAIGQGHKLAARAQGRDEKRWRTANDNRVSQTICAPNQGEGWIHIDQTFQSGHETIPGHVRCRCNVEYRTKRLQ